MPCFAGQMPCAKGREPNAAVDSFDYKPLRRGFEGGLTLNTGSQMPRLLNALCRRKRESDAALNPQNAGVKCR